MNYFTQLPEELVEYIVVFKFGTEVYRKQKKQWRYYMLMVHYELKKWYNQNYSISFLKSSYCQRKRAPAFKKSLQSGPPLLTCHVGLFCSKIEVDAHRTWLMSKIKN